MLEVIMLKKCLYLEFSGPYFPAFRLKWYEYGKIWTRKTPNTDTFHAVYYMN